MAALLAILSSVVFGVADFLGGMASRRIPAALASAVAIFLGLLLLTGMALLTGGSPTTRDMVLGMLTGVIAAAAISAFYFGLSIGSMSVVAPTSAVTSAIVPVLAGVGLGEAPGLVTWLGVLVAIPAILLISREGTAEPDAQTAEPLEERTTPDQARLGLLTGLGAGFGFGLFVVVITRTSSESGLWPLVGSRAVASALMVVAVLVTGVVGSEVRNSPDLRAGILLALGAGALDSGSNILVLEAGRRGLIVIVGVITALYPASTIMLARIVLHERLQRRQLCGLGMAVVAVLLIAL